MSTDTAFVEKGQWMMKPKAAKDGKSGGGLKGLFGGGGWNKRYVWVQNKALCYGAKEGKAEKSIPLATWRVTRPMSAEDVKKARGPADKVNCGWELLANDRVIQFTTDSPASRDSFVRGMNTHLNSQLGAGVDCDFDEEEGDLDWDDDTTDTGTARTERSVSQMNPETEGTPHGRHPGSKGASPNTPNAPPPQQQQKKAADVPNYDEELSDEDKDVNMDYDDDDGVDKDQPPSLPEPTDDEMQRQKEEARKAQAKADEEEKAQREKEVAAEKQRQDAAKAAAERSQKEAEQRRLEAEVQQQEFSAQRSTVESQEASSRNGHQGDEFDAWTQHKTESNGSLESAIRATRERMERQHADDRQVVLDGEGNERMMVVQEERGVSNALYTEALEGLEGASAAIMEREHDNERTELLEAAAAALGAVAAEERSVFPTIVDNEPSERAAAKEATHQRVEGILADARAQFEESEAGPRATIAKQEGSQFNSEIAKKHKFELTMVQQAVSSRLRVEAKQARSGLESSETFDRLDLIETEEDERVVLANSGAESKKVAQSALDSRLDQERLEQEARRKKEQGDQLGALQDDELAGRKGLQTAEAGDFSSTREEEVQARTAQQEKDEAARKKKVEEEQAEQARLKQAEADALASAEAAAAAEAELKARQEELEQQAKLKRERDAEEQRAREEEAAAREREAAAEEARATQAAEAANQKTIAAQAAEREARQRNQEKDQTVAQRQDERVAGKTAAPLPDEEKARPQRTEKSPSPQQVQKSPSPPQDEDGEEEQLPPPPPAPTGPTPEQVQYDKEMAQYEVAVASFEANAKAHQDKQAQLKQYRSFLTQGVWAHKPAAEKSGNSGSFLKFGGGWKRRYVQLQQGKDTLQYSEGPGKASKGTFNFGEIMAIEQLSGKQGAELKAPSKYANFCFCIGTDDKNYNFACEQANDCRQFVLALTEVTMSYQKPSKAPVPPQKPVLKKAAVPPPAAATATPRSTTAAASAGSSAAAPSPVANGQTRGRASSSGPGSSPAKTTAPLPDNSSTSRTRGQTTVVTSPAKQQNDELLTRQRSQTVGAQPAVQEEEEYPSKSPSEAGDEDDLSPHDPWGDDDEDDEEEEWEVCLDVVEKGVWMHKPPASTTSGGGGFFKLGGGWKRRYVWVNDNFLYYGESADTAKVDKRVPLKTVTGAANLTVKEADALKAPEKFARSTWRLTSEGKNIVFACEKGMDREFFVNYFNLYIKRAKAAAQPTSKQNLSKQNLKQQGKVSNRSLGGWDDIPDSTHIMAEHTRDSNRASVGPKGNQAAEVARMQDSTRNSNATTTRGSIPASGPASAQETKKGSNVVQPVYEDDNDGEDDDSFKWSEADEEETSDFDGGAQNGHHDHHSHQAGPESHGRGGSNEKKAQDDESLLGADRCTAVPLATLNSFVNLVVAVVKPAKEEGLSGSAVHDRDALALTKCGDCDLPLIGKMTTLFHKGDELEKFHTLSTTAMDTTGVPPTKESAKEQVRRGVKSSVISVQIETDKRTITVGTMTSQPGDPFLMTTLIS